MSIKFQQKQQELLLYLLIVVEQMEALEYYYQIPKNALLKSQNIFIHKTIIKMIY